LPNNVAVTIDFDHAIVKLIGNQVIATLIKPAVLRHGREAAREQDGQKTS
jgi:hypothetical protein